MNKEKVVEYLLNEFDGVRYVAIYTEKELFSKQKGDLENSSSENSDRYEELLVNPSLLTLARQRGDIDCGGLNFIVVAYGNFFQVIKEIPGGHISICLAKFLNPTQTATLIFERLNNEFVLN